MHLSFTVEAPGQARGNGIELRVEIFRFPGLDPGPREVERSSIAFYVYIVTNPPRCTVLYTGHTDDLDRRAADHVAGPGRPAHAKGFAARNNCTRLVWWEGHETREAAHRREATIKRWRRAWKEELIEAMNPNWEDPAPHHRLG